MAIETPLVALPKVMMPEICTPMVGDAMRDICKKKQRHTGHYLVSGGGHYKLSDGTYYTVK